MLMYGLTFLTLCVTVSCPSWTTIVLFSLTSMIRYGPRYKRNSFLISLSSTEDIRCFRIITCWLTWYFINFFPWSIFLFRCCNILFILFLAVLTMILPESLLAFPMLISVWVGPSLPRWASGDRVCSIIIREFFFFYWTQLVCFRWQYVLKILPISLLALSTGLPSGL